VYRRHPRSLGLNLPLCTKQKAPRRAGLCAPDSSAERVSRTCSGGAEEIRMVATESLSNGLSSQTGLELETIL
jgi:hypothetical protein